MTSRLFPPREIRPDKNLFYPPPLSATLPFAHTQDFFLRFLPAAKPSGPRNVSEFILGWDPYTISSVFFCYTLAS